MKSFNAIDRTSILQHCEASELDVIVVGGGITGAGILLDAARRNLRVALFEKNDFASGTSSVSSKLVHGGLRYLETFDIGLVFESVRDRKRLLKLAPSLVKPLEFLIPVYRGQRRSLWTVYVGTWIYYLLALFRNIGRPKKNGIQSTADFEPNLATKNLLGSIQYYDAGTIDSRLTLSAIKTATDFGALACNHAKVIDYYRVQDRIAGVIVEDQITKKTYTIKAKWVVNAVGPWTDIVRKHISILHQKTVRLTKGAHILLPGNPFGIHRAILMLSPIDGRVVFMIPWCEQTLIGTTDDDFLGDPQNLRVDNDDIDYLMRTAKHYFPTVSINASQIMTTFVGLRCLREENKNHPSDVSREYMLFSDEPGLLTISGGKLTTFLSMGSDVVDWLCEKESQWKCCGKAKLRKLNEVWPIDVFQNPTQEIFETLIEKEMAVTIRDLLQFRTLAYFLYPDHGASLINIAKRALQNKLGYSEEEMEKQIQEYKNELNKQTHR